MGIEYLYYPVDIREAAWLASIVMLLAVHGPVALFARLKLHIGTSTLLRQVYSRPIATNICFLILLWIATAAYDLGHLTISFSVALAACAAIGWAGWRYLIREILAQPNGARSSWATSPRTAG